MIGDLARPIINQQSPITNDSQIKDHQIKDGTLSAPRS
jgi:hypothetical protein